MQNQETADRDDQSILESLLLCFWVSLSVSLWISILVCLCSLVMLLFPAAHALTAGIIVTVLFWDLGLEPPLQRGTCDVLPTVATAGRPLPGAQLPIRCQKG